MIPKLTKKLLHGLQYAAKQKGRTHHDGGVVVSPREARALLQVIEALEWYSDMEPNDALAAWWHDTADDREVVV